MLGADTAYDAEDFANELRAMNARPHVAQNTNGRASAIDGRNDPPSRLRLKSTHPQAERRGLWLDQDDHRVEVITW